MAAKKRKGRKNRRTEFCHRAAVLLNKDKVGVGEEPFEDVEHLAHDGDESDHLRFAGRDEARVVGAQYLVVSGGGDGRHVEGRGARGRVHRGLGEPDGCGHCRAQRV